MKTATPNARNAELARIHIAKAQLGLADDTYRATIRGISNQRTDSAKDLDYGERAKLLEHLRRLGFRDRGALPSRQAAAAKQALIDKIHAHLATASRPWAYADGMARRMFRIERVDWLTPQQLHKLVAAFEYDAKRRARKAAEVGA
ncbi:MAG: regulatory protein GemA [Burkholderiales bacterium]|nr:regulatory protein GemA [Burkholderiales bacterium]